MTAIHYRTAKADGRNIFYREAGAQGAAKLLLLHGFPTAGHMFRDLIPLIADRFHIVAPDLPGFGTSDMPDKANTFDQIAETIDRFTEVVGFDRYAPYVFDYGAPTGFRLAVKHPERITAIISQNGNAYEEGLERRLELRSGPIGRIPRRPIATRCAPSSSRKRRCGNIPTAFPTRRLFRRTATRSTISTCPGPAPTEVQLDLMGDYKSNVALYPTFQHYFRTHKPPLLATWGKNDPFFLPPGAEAFKRDIPNATVRFFDTGHFALETHAAEIATAILEFLPEGA